MKDYRSQFDALRFSPEEKQAMIDDLLATAPETRRRVSHKKRVHVLIAAVIAGNCLRTQRKFGNIFLAAFYSKFQQTSCTARKNRKNSCRVRVKSSPMSDFLCVKHAPQKADNIE